MFDSSRRARNSRLSWHIDHFQHGQARQRRQAVGSENRVSVGFGLELILADPGDGGSKVSNGKSSCRRLRILPGRCNKSKGRLDPPVFVGLFLYKICESWSSHFSCFQGIVRTEKNSPVESDCAWLIWKDLLEKLVEDKDIWGMVLKCTELNLQSKFELSTPNYQEKEKWSWRECKYVED